MKIYKPQNQLVRVSIKTQNTDQTHTAAIKFSIAESDCSEVCKLIESIFPENRLPTTSGARGNCKNRSVKIDVSELDSSGEKLRKVSRTINLHGINAADTGERLVKAINAADRQGIINRGKELEGIR